MWKNIAEPENHAHCMLGTKAYKHLLRIYKTSCFPLQKWLHKNDPLLRFTYIACLINFNILTRKAFV